MHGLPLLIKVGWLSFGAAVVLGAGALGTGSFSLSSAGQARASVALPATAALGKTVALPLAPQLLFPPKEMLGKYYFGDGLGANCSLYLTANHRFEFAWYGCMGEYDRNHGSWTLKGDVLVLKPELPNKQEGFEGMNVRFVPVKWGARHLLVDENEMPGFCASARGQNPPSESIVRGIDYYKTTPRDVPSHGKPLIPVRFQEFYKKGPVTARVVRIDQDGNVTLHSGSMARLQPGMLLDTTGMKNINLEVLHVSNQEAIAKPFYFWNSDQRVEVGDAFTTGANFSRPQGTGYPRFSTPPDETKAKPKKTSKTRA